MGNMMKKPRSILTEKSCFFAITTGLSLLFFSRHRRGLNWGFPFGNLQHTTMPTHAHTKLYILSKCQQSVTGSLIVFLYLISSGTGSQLNALCGVSLSCYTFWHDGLVYVIKKNRTAEKQLAERGRKYGVEQSLGQRGRVIDSDPRRDQYNATSSDTTYRVKFEPKRDWVMEWRYQFIQGIFLSMLFKQCSGDNSLSAEKAKELRHIFCA